MAAAAILKFEKAPYFSNGLTDRHEISIATTGMVTQFHPLDPSDRQNNTKIKNPRWRQTPLLTRTHQEMR